MVPQTYSSSSQSLWRFLNNPSLFLSTLLHIGLLAIPISSNPQNKPADDPKTSAVTKTVSLNQPQKTSSSVSRPKPKPKPRAKPKTATRNPPRPYSTYRSAPVPSPARPAPQAPTAPPNKKEKDSSTHNSQDADPKGKDSPDQDAKFAALQNQFVKQVFEELTASGGNESFGSAPSDFPQPEAFFTPASITAYNPTDGAIEMLPGIINAPRYHERVSPADFYPILQDIPAFQGFEFEQVGDYGGGPLYAAKKGKEVYYINLVKVNRLGKGTFLVFWEWNPLNTPGVVKSES